MISNDSIFGLFLQYLIDLFTYTIDGFVELYHESFANFLFALVWGVGSVAYILLAGYYSIKFIIIRILAERAEEKEYEQNED